MADKTKTEEEKDQALEGVYGQVQKFMTRYFAMTRAVYSGAATIAVALKGVSLPASLSWCGLR